MNHGAPQATRCPWHLTATARRAASALLLLAAAWAAACRPESPPSGPRTAHQSPPPPFDARAYLAAEPGPRTRRTLDYWRAKPPPPALLGHTLAPEFTPALAQHAADLKQGLFTPQPRLYPPQPLGVPPPWDVDPVGDRTWDFNRHTLRWLEPLLTAWIATGDTAALHLAHAVVRDWETHNRVPPGASAYAWSDHTLAGRLRLLLWFWEAYRCSPEFAADDAAVLLRLLHQHAAAIASGETYRADSNHGLEQNLALIAAATALPELSEAGAWRTTALERTDRYCRDNFTADGFHREQTPGYHWYVLERCGSLLEFLQAYGEAAPDELAATTRRAAGVWPYLIRPDGEFVSLGDGRGRAPRYAARYATWFGAAPPVAPVEPANPRDDGAAFLVSYAGTYAILAAAPVTAPQRDPDTYLVFRCNAYAYTHYHRDALSFVLYGRGREWLCDAGLYSFEEETPQRLYVRSPRAHNVVLVDAADFQLGPVTLVAAGREAAGDFVTARHELPQAVHTRTLRFEPPYTVTLTDDLAARDEGPHAYTQVFHTAPELQVRIVSDRTAEIRAADGTGLSITQQGVGGAWQIITGQTDPYWQGWYSPSFRELVPAPALYFTTAPLRAARFETRLELQPPLATARE